MLRAALDHVAVVFAGRLPGSSGEDLLADVDHTRAARQVLPSQTHKTAIRTSNGEAESSGPSLDYSAESGAPPYCRSRGGFDWLLIQDLT